MKDINWVGFKQGLVHWTTLFLVLLLLYPQKEDSWMFFGVKGVIALLLLTIYIIKHERKSYLSYLMDRYTWESVNINEFLFLFRETFQSYERSMWRINKFTKEAAEVLASIEMRYAERQEALFLLGNQPKNEKSLVQEKQSKTEELVKKQYSQEKVLSAYFQKKGMNMTTFDRDVQGKYDKYTVFANLTKYHILFKGENMIYFKKEP
ncbi:hypothetical protein [Listeria seeligeri]|uniref:hypothetical protein n=1 Tax=Listeria seeligeri TaxID=1640 RepID=UPI0022EB1DDB|nr:hypothetical protein [Listeria seeligeri]